MSKRDFIPITRPTFGPEEEKAVREVLRSGWVTQGPKVAAFEKEFARLTGARYASAVSSCTTALHLALKAAGVGPKDEVITVSHSFVATAASIRYLGAVPVFADIEPSSFNIDPRRIEPLITPRTRAILCVHQIGMPCDMPAILRIARRHKLFVIEDAACAIGSEIRAGRHWEKIGKPHGDAACFSFHPRKVMTTGDGGMITTRHASWDRKFRLWRQHGMSVTDLARHGGRRPVVESYVELGFNYRMTDLQAAVGRVQLRRLGGMVRRRRVLARRYTQKLQGITGLAAPAEPPGVRSNFQSYCVRLPEGVSQKRVMTCLLKEGIAVKTGILCAHREPVFTREPFRAGTLTQSERAQDTAILLPLYDSLQTAEQDRVIRALAAALERR
ncbi:MAG: DegT/DnrJ/EryC1/StrS family aminotransferase [Candidatus Omnitrophica bacterium]|nr:DegT/DnrJ/EryC1/StrS family aminotransferase [Candidatus Omnitrophota bacterium]